MKFMLMENVTDEEIILSLNKSDYWSDNIIETLSLNNYKTISYIQSRFDPHY